MSISYRKDTNRYTVRRRLNGKNKYVGTFKTKEEAEKAEQDYINNSHMSKQIEKEFDDDFESLYNKNRLDTTASHYKDPDWWNEQSRLSMNKILSNFS